MATRAFRSPESIAAETATRDRISALLARHGFQDIEDHRERRNTAVTQTISAHRDGQPYSLHVRLCWSRIGRNAKEQFYSAAQLRMKLIDNNWDRTLAFIADRAAERAITHSLFIQDGVSGIDFAALVPSSEIPAIWQTQREVSARISAQGLSGRWKKNHAENGSSPTIWLQDDRWPHTHQVADVLWNWPGVVNLLKLPASAEALADDSVADLPLDTSFLGTDVGERLTSVRSSYRRDPHVRAAVLTRSSGKCERAGCGETRDYSGFLDVHHILGVGVSDRVWTCVALCPNCHREAHFATDRNQINAELQSYAERFA